MGYSVLRSGVKMLVEVENVPDMVCVGEIKISCRTNNTASAVRSTTEKFSGMGEGEEGHIRICAVGGLPYPSRRIRLRAWLWSHSTGVVHLAFGFPGRVLVRAAIAI